METVDAAIGPEVYQHKFVLKFPIESQGFGVKPSVVRRKLFDFELKEGVRHGDRELLV
jgi:hypothetical protein